MCGIAGFIKKDKSYLTKSHEIIHDITYFNRLRGVDAFGMYKADLVFKKHDSIKEVGDPYELLLQNNKIKAFLNGVGNNEYFVMHNRHATKGDKKDQGHAHPFVISKENGKGAIMLVHNGTINHFKNEKDFPGKTDSHTVAKMLASGMSMTELEDSFFGSWALVWYDSQDQSLNFWRNDARPLGFVHTKDAIWFGSEHYIVAAALDRRGCKVEDFVNLPVMEHWKWKNFEFTKEKVKIQRGVVADKPSKSPKIQDEEEAASSTLDPNAFKDEEGDPTLVELPKSITSNASARGGTYTPTKIPVEPYPPRVPRPGAKKVRWHKATNIMGLEIGAWVVFSLCDAVGTKRGNQTNLVGRMVSYPGRGPCTPRVEFNVEIVGMIGRTKASVMESNKFFTGEIKECQQTLVGSGHYKYRFIVKDIKETTEVDPFLSFQRNGTQPNPEKFCYAGGGTVKLKDGIPTSASQPTTPTIVPLVKPTKTEEKEYADYSKATPCFKCSKKFSPGHIHRIKDRVEGSSTLNLCSGCFTEAITDQNMIPNLLKQVALLNHVDLTKKAH
jgi:predicted glutamine amidotransferase